MVGENGQVFPTTAKNPKNRREKAQKNAHCFIACPQNSGGEPRFTDTAECYSGRTPLINDENVVC